MSLSRVNWKLASTGFFGFALWLGLLFLCFVIGERDVDHYLNFAIMIAASAVGWLVGILASPYDPDEQKRFSSVTQAVSAFVSGYLAAKLDALVNAVVAPSVLLHPLPAFRVLLFVATALLTTLGTFAYRKYA